MPRWQEIETTTHQDHVIKHVIGATVLGWFIANEAAHLLLDIGFLWTIYLDGEMNLLPQGVAIAELEADELTSVDKTELIFDAELLLNEGRQAPDLKRLTGASVDCLIDRVDFLASNTERRVVIHGEIAKIEIETSLESGQVTIHSKAS